MSTTCAAVDGMDGSCVVVLSAVIANWDSQLKHDMRTSASESIKCSFSFAEVACWCCLSMFFLPQMYLARPSGMGLVEQSVFRLIFVMHISSTQTHSALRSYLHHFKSLLIIPKRSVGGGFGWYIQKFHFQSVPRAKIRQVNRRDRCRSCPLMVKYDTRGSDHVCGICMSLSTTLMTGAETG